MSDRKIEQYVARCRHPLEVRLIVDPNKGWFASVAYEGCMPAIVRSEKIPDSVEEFLADAIEQFDLEKNNESASQHRLLNSDKDVEPVKPVKSVEPKAASAKDKTGTKTAAKTKAKTKAKKRLDTLFRSRTRRDERLGKREKGRMNERND